MLRIMLLVLVILLPGANIAKGKLLDNGDGTVSDLSSGLMWQQIIPGFEMDWLTAQNYCDKLILGGYEDWRLPSQDELRTLIHPTAANPVIDTAFFPDTPLEPFWTDTSFPYNSKGAWAVDSKKGRATVWNKQESLHVRAVRSVADASPTENGPSERFTFHQPELPDDPVRHCEIYTDLVDGYVLIFKKTRIGFDLHETRWGLLGPDGKIFIEPIYEGISVMGDHFVVSTGGLVNFVNRKGDLVFDRFYLKISPIENSYSHVQNATGHEGLLDSKGKLLGGQWFDRVGPMRNGWACTMKNGVGGFLSANGSQRLDLPFEGPYSPESFNDGYALVGTMEGDRFINPALQIASPQLYSSAKSFSQGRAAVMIDNYWYFVDKNFKFINDKKYIAVESFENGIAKVEPDYGHHDYINLKGESILNNGVSVYGSFSEGFCRVKKDEKINYIDNKGRILSKNQWFDYAEPFENGVGRVRKDTSWNLIKSDGKLAGDLWFDELKPLSERFHPLTFNVVHGGEYNILDAQYRNIFQKSYFTAYPQNRVLEVKFPDHETMLLDYKGQPVIPERIHVAYEGSYGYLHVESVNGREALVDSFLTPGNPIATEWFDRISNFSRGNQCIPVSRNKRENLMFTDGSFFFDPWVNRIEKAFGQHDLYAVRFKEGYLVFDDTCHLFSENIFDEVETRIGFFDQMCVRKDNQWFRLRGAGSIESVRHKDCFHKES